jgi:hypothetical protein
MKGHMHLLLNAIALIGAYLILFLLGIELPHMNVFLAIAVFYVFSTLPDIDSSTSGISKSLFMAYLALAGYGIWLMSMKGIILIIIAAALAAYHWTMSENSKHHRKFPHSILFGSVCSGILWYFTSWPYAILGMICFCLHLLEDI